MLFIAQLNCKAVSKHAANFHKDGTCRGLNILFPSRRRAGIALSEKCVNGDASTNNHRYRPENGHKMDGTTNSCQGLDMVRLRPGQ